MGNGKYKQFFASSVSQLSVMVASVAYSWFEPITIRLTKDPKLNLTPEDVSWLITIVEIGAIISPPVSGYLADRIGRKYVIMSIAPLCLAGWVVVLFSKSLISLILVRMLHGVGVGVAFTVTSIYSAEIAEPKVRGRLSGTYQLMGYFGNMYSFSLGAYLNYDMFSYACIPLPIIFTILLIILPETPYYLLMTKREEAAKKVLEYFRDGDVEEELQDMQKAVMEEMSTKGSWKTLICDKIERKAFIILQIVSITKYLGGMTVIENYALDTFSKSESFLSAENMSILLVTLLILFAMISAFLSDSVGRKPLLLISCFGSFVAHFLIGGYYYIHEKTTIDSSNFIWALYIGMTMYCVFLAIGSGPLLQTLQSEMFGASTRGIAAGITQGLASFLSLIAMKLYTPVNEAYGVYLNYWCYSLISLLGGVSLSVLMFETAGKTIGRMEDATKKRANSLRE